MKCPRCNLEELHQREAMNALSRRDNNTYICAPCGREEGMYDLAPQHLTKAGLQRDTAFSAKVKR